MPAELGEALLRRGGWEVYLGGQGNWEVLLERLEKREVLPVR